MGWPPRTSQRIHREVPSCLSSLIQPWRGLSHVHLDTPVLTPDLYPHPPQIAAPWPTLWPGAIGGGQCSPPWGYRPGSRVSGFWLGNPCAQVPEARIEGRASALTGSSADGLLPLWGRGRAREEPRKPTAWVQDLMEPWLLCWTHKMYLCSKKV